jgi:ACR3 family arsenite transporter
MSELSLEEITLPKLNIQASPISPDIEAQSPEKGPEPSTSIAEKESIFKSLGWLDRFLALWIFLAMAIGIILGNFVPNTGPALQKGRFVGVSVPIGMFLLFLKKV